MKPLKTWMHLGVALGFLGCGGVDDLEVGTLGQAVVVMEPGCTTLYAGQHTDVGTVCVAVEPDVDTAEACGEGAQGVVTVTYATHDGWMLMEAHLAAGPDRAALPVNKSGNPVPGRFPYHSGPIQATEYKFLVPLCVFGLDGAQAVCDPVTAYFAAHAVVRHPRYGTETAWGDGARFVMKGNWGEFFTQTLTCEPPEPPPPERCETAWAYSTQALSFCKNDLDGDGEVESRWGWYLEVMEGLAIWPLYAGAGQCELANGTRVGYLVVKYDGATTSAEYVMDAGFTLKETHLYVGAEPPTQVAPGKLGHMHEDLGGATHDLYVLPMTGEHFHMAAHAVVCGF